MAHSIMCPGCLIQFRLGPLSLLVSLSCPTPPGGDCQPEVLPQGGRLGSSEVGELEICSTSWILLFSFSWQELPESLLCTVYVRSRGIKAFLRQKGQCDNISNSQELGSLVPASSLTCFGLRAKVHFHNDL